MSSFTSTVLIGNSVGVKIAFVHLARKNNIMHNKEFYNGHREINPIYKHYSWKIEIQREAK